MKVSVFFVAGRCGISDKILNVEPVEKGTSLKNNHFWMKSFGKGPGFISIMKFSGTLKFIFSLKKTFSTGSLCAILVFQPFYLGISGTKNIKFLNAKKY